MKGNIGRTDKLIRIAAAFILASLVIFKIATGVSGTIFLVAAVIFLLTALINFCPIWHFLGISTKKDSHQSPHNQSPHNQSA